MRFVSILSLKWSQIPKSFIWLDKTKTDEARQIQINSDLAECFKPIRKSQILGTEYIFCDQNGHIKDMRAAFNAALKKAGSLDFRPHDLRHTFASHYLMRGGSLRVLQKNLGHRDLKLTMRHAHLSKEFAKEEIKLLDGLT